jgi:hypothetical protein
MSSQVQVPEGARIENPREYDNGVVENLRQLLQTGAPTHRDARRKNFYQIDANEETYYVHISPVSGNVVLLARWLRQTENCVAASGCALA